MEFDKSVRVGRLKAQLDKHHEISLVINKNGTITSYRNQPATRRIEQVVARVMDPSAPIFATPIELVGRTNNGLANETDQYTKLEIHPTTKNQSRLDIFHKDPEFDYRAVIETARAGLRIYQLAYLIESQIDDELMDFTRVRITQDGSMEARIVDQLEEVGNPDPNFFSYLVRMKRSLSRKATRVTSLVW